MKALLNIIEKMKPSFEKGGKYEKLHSTFDAIETFLFNSKVVTKNGVHIKDAIDLKRTMSVVVFALLPSLFFGMWNVGYQHFLSIGDASKGFFDFLLFGALEVMPIVIVSYVVGLGIEFIVAQVKGHEVNEGFLVSGMLIPLVMPVDTPLWMVAVATAFAVFIGKEIFGGTGMNIFNPALLARAFIFFAYTPFISGEKIWIAGMTEGKGVMDGFSGATPLTEYANSLTSGVDPIFKTTPMDWFMGYIPGSIGETSTLAILLGAVILIVTGIASWRIIVATFVGGYLMGLLFNLADSNSYMSIPAYYHLILGGFAFGAVFMTTDPVTGSQTNTGKWIYGLLTGALAIIIRVMNPGYPEGMMLAILFMNAMAPLIDHYVVSANIKRRLSRVVKSVK